MRSSRPTTLSRIFVAAVACLAVAASAQQPLSSPLQAQFRGCDAAGWCRFRIESSAYAEESVLRVRPDGVRAAAGEAARLLRDRLNALMADMIHQHKRIELHNMHVLENNLFAATVLVNGADVATDARIRELMH